jgi:hypothetical protein
VEHNEAAPELRTLIAELALRDAERDQSQRRDESSPSP